MKDGACAENHSGKYKRASRYNLGRNGVIMAFPLAGTGTDTERNYISFLLAEPLFESAVIHFIKN